MFTDRALSIMVSYKINNKKRLSIHLQQPVDNVMNKGCHSKLKQKYKISKNDHLKLRTYRKKICNSTKELKNIKVCMYVNAQISDHYDILIQCYM